MMIEPSDQHVNNGQISPDFIVCMLFAYLKQIYILDGMDKSAPVLKSVPRSNNGEIDAEILGDMERGLTSLHILADPTSGFLITLKVSETVISLCELHYIEVYGITE